ncbi:MAG: hydrogenase maturation nickel metallochaperone HypA, partial [Desulfobacterales bacterium]|nr:hydrogenase maturation nickel metallochaperone HypA [Desulfobacterales bacterium]
DLEDEWIQHYFDYLSKETLAEEAKLVIERIPIVLKCNECAHSFEIKKHEMKEIQCPKCKNQKCSLESGREYYIKHMEVI